MLNSGLIAQATHVLETLRRLEMQLATVESCTGGLIAATMTEIAGSSDVFERGFVTYSNEAKIDLLGIDPTLIALHGAVSREVALAMAIGGLDFSNADIAVSVTGIAGPGGGTPDKPVGLVHLATAGPGHTPLHQELRLGDIGRSEIRRLTVTAALDLILAACATTETGG